MVPKNTPDQIYIDVEDKELECQAEDFETLENPKWCEEDIWEHSVRYVRSDLPICTATERAFLDELKSKSKYIGKGMGECLQYNGKEGTTEIYQYDFKTQLKELVNDIQTKAD